MANNNAEVNRMDDTKPANYTMIDSDAADNNNEMVGPEPLTPEAKILDAKFLQLNTIRGVITSYSPIKEEDIDKVTKAIDDAISALSPYNKDYTMTDIDDRLPYRQGWPLLPVLPVLTSHVAVPKVFASSSTHLTTFCNILKEHGIEVEDEDVNVVHRYNAGHRYDAGNNTIKTTLTLSVLSSSSENAKWPPAIRALRAYIKSQELRLNIEMIDRRIYHGIYTLPILPHETALFAATAKKKRQGIKHILEDSGLEWTSLELWWRSMGRTREDCKPTVLIGTPEPQKEAWWGAVREKVMKKMSGKWDFEVCFREVVK